MRYRDFLRPEREAGKKALRKKGGRGLTFTSGGEIMKKGPIEQFGHTFGKKRQSKGGTT